MVRALPFAAASALLIAVPVAAQQQPDIDPRTEQALATLENPATADAVANLAESLARSLMAMPVGEIARAVRQIDPDSRVADLPADATLGDLAGSGEMDPQRLGDDVHAATRMAAGMSRQLVALLPTFEAMARDMAAQWEIARREQRRR